MKTKGLGWFKNIVLLGSAQDNYAPFESARIQQCLKGDPNDEYGTKKKNKEQNRKVKLQRMMAENIMKQVKVPLIHRIDVNFEINAKYITRSLGDMP